MTPWNHVRTPMLTLGKYMYQLLPAALFYNMHNTTTLHDIFALNRHARTSRNSSNGQGCPSMSAPSYGLCSLQQVQESMYRWCATTTRHLLRTVRDCGSGLDGFVSTPFVEVYPVSSVCAQTEEKVAQSELFAHWGYPHTVLIDNGVQFTSRT
ncbi:hypothetical protein PR048_016025, partial [Dryococelus australis]